MFELLVMCIQEYKRSLGRYTRTLAVIITVVLIYPQHILLGYVPSTSYGFVASKVALGENKSTPLPASSEVIYALTTPA